MKLFLQTEFSIVTGSKFTFESEKKDHKVLSNSLTRDEYQELFIVYKKEGNFKKMIEVSEQLLRIQVNQFGKYHKKTVVAILKLADAYHISGEESKAVLLYEKVVAINNRIYGVDCLENTTVFSLLGNISFAMDKQEEALLYYKKALNLCQKELGELHPLTAKSNYELGFFYASMEEYELALPLFESALTTRVELYRMSHPETAISFNSLALCYYHLFEYKKAYNAMVKAIEIKKMILPSNDKSLFICKKNLVEIEKKISFKSRFLRTLLSFFRK